VRQTEGDTVHTPPVIATAVVSVALKSHTGTVDVRCADSITSARTTTIASRHVEHAIVKDSDHHVDTADRDHDAARTRQQPALKRRCDRSPRPAGIA
jgi:hypothetical protein